MSITNKKRILISFLLLVFSVCSFAQTSSLVYEDGNGDLQYGTYKNEGQGNSVNTVPDFSRAGYKGGGVPIPFVPAVVTITTPTGGDDRSQIQAAIDTVEGMALGTNGFRGAVLIKAGNYKVGSTLKINESGVVLRGEGQQATGGTRITITRTSQDNLLEISGSGGYSTGSSKSITDSYVPVGAMSVTVSDGSGFSVGDKIEIKRNTNNKWINDLGMDDYGWSADSYETEYQRVITAKAGNVIYLDAPIIHVIEDLYGGGQIAKYTFSGQIENIGVEGIRFQSTFTSSTDENHGFTAIEIDDARNVWVRQCTARYFMYSLVDVLEMCHFITIEDCAYLDPKSQIVSGRRYPYCFDDSSYWLVQRCFAKKARHDFATQSRTPGPGVFVDNLATDSYNDNGPHQRYSIGNLYDNCKGPEFRVQNRRDSGSGHGWSGAQIMFWNCRATGHFLCDAPKGAMSWLIGGVGTHKAAGQWSPDEPEGIWESQGTHVTPRSLYYRQLQERLGRNALRDVIIPEQEAGNIWTALGNWAGNGLFGDDVIAWTSEDSITSPTNSVTVDARVRNLQMLDNGVTSVWTKVSGPGNVTFGDASAMETSASFSQGGTYTLRITVDDSSTTASADVTVDFANGSVDITASGATGLGANQAILKGDLHVGGPADVYVVWDTIDKGTNNLNAWTYTNILSSQASGSFSSVATGLTAEISYTYRCFASNAVSTGWSGDHSFIIPDTSGPLWTPSNITTVAWYDASDTSTITDSAGSVSQWDDKSGNGNDVRQTSGDKPTTTNRTIGGLNALDFDDQSLGITNRGIGLTGNPDLIMASILQYDANIGSSDRAVSLGGGSGNAFQMAGGSHGYSIRYNNGNLRFATTITGAPILQVCKKNAGGTYNQVEMFINGTLSAVTLGSTSDTISLTDDVFWIGKGQLSSGPPTFTGPINGMIGEVVIVNASDTETQQKVEGYLAWKWGREADLPIGHPYKSYAPVRPADPNTFNITASVVGGGFISPNGVTQVSESNNQSFVIAPDVNYSIDSVDVDGTNMGAIAGYTFTNVTAPHTIEATFALNAYEIDITVSGATSLGVDQATLNGDLDLPGLADIYVVWDTTDKGTNNLNLWTYTNILSSQVSGPFNVVATGLTSLASYTYRCFASNAVDTGWSGASSFIVPNASSPTSKDHITGERQSGGEALGYYTTGDVNITGTAGGSGSRTDRNLVMGYQLPTLTASHSVTGATFSFEITGARDSTGATNLPNLQVYILDTTNPDSSGTNFFYHGSGDSSTNVELVDTTSVTLSGTAQNDFSDDAEDRTFELSGSALDLVKSYYGGDHIPDRTEIFFRFSMDEDPSTNTMRRYNIDLAVDESQFEVAGQVPGVTHSITSSVVGNGTINPSGVIQIPDGTNQAYTITPDANYHIVSVDVDGTNQGAVAGYTFTNVTATHDIEATFAIDTYQVIFDLGTNGTRSGGGALTQTVNHAASATAPTVTPDATYVLDGWDKSFTSVTSNMTVNAQYSFVPVGTLWTPSNITTVAWYDAADASTITDVAGSVSQWDDKSGNSNDVSQASGADQPVTTNRTIGGLNALDFYSQSLGITNSGIGLTGNPDLIIATVLQYDTTVGSSDRAVSLGGGAGNAFQMAGGSHGYSMRYNDGNVKYGSTITGTPILQVCKKNAGGTYNQVEMFINGTLSAVTSAGSSDTINLTDDVFWIGKGQLSSGPPTFTGPINGMIGEIVIVNASDTETRQRVEGYLAWKWGREADLPIGHPYKGYAPVHSTNTFNITSSVVGSGTISPNGVIQVTESNNQAFVISPAANYHIDYVEVDTTNKGAIAGYTFTNVTAPHTIKATFAIDTYQVIFDLGTNGTRTGGGALTQTVNHAASATAPTIAPDTGYTLSGWDKSFASVTSNMTVNAQYSLTNYTLIYNAAANGSIVGVATQTVSHGSDGSAVTPTPATDYHFVNWSDSSTADPRTDLGVTNDITVTANFAIDTNGLTAKGVPEYWLFRHGLTNGGYAAAELTDIDGDGMPAWKEYHAGTIPTDYFSSFKIILHPGSLPTESTNGFQFIPGTEAWSLVFLGGTNDSNIPFEIYRCTNLMAGNWLYATNFVRTDGVNGTNTWVDLDASNYWPCLFYRISAPTN